MLIVQSVALMALIKSNQISTILPLSLIPITEGGRKLRWLHGHGKMENY
jgi:hypothetical protein